MVQLRHLFPCNRGFLRHTRHVHVWNFTDSRSVNHGTIRYTLLPTINRCFQAIVLTFSPFDPFSTILLIFASLLLLPYKSSKVKLCLYLVLPLTAPPASPLPWNFALVVPTRFFSGAGGIILPKWECFSTSFSCIPRKSEKRLVTVTLAEGVPRRCGKDFVVVTCIELFYCLSSNHWHTRVLRNVWK